MHRYRYYKYSVGAGHARDEGFTIVQLCPNIAGMARSYDVTVINVMAVMQRVGTSAICVYL
jgi:hypothetical protein